MVHIENQPQKVRKIASRAAVVALLGAGLGAANQVGSVPADSRDNDPVGATIFVNETDKRVSGQNFDMQEAVRIGDAIVLTKSGPSGASQTETRMLPSAGAGDTATQIGDALVQIQGAHPEIRER